MALKGKTLGKGLGELGLSELLGQVNAPSQPVEAPKATQSVPVVHCQPSPFQPRRVMDPEALKALSDSIESQGIIAPIIVRAVGVDRYEIIAGERRWRAAQMAGLQEVPVLVKDYTDAQAMAVALIENIQREDLNVMEESRALQRLVSEYHMTHEALAKSVGRSRSQITNLLRLQKCPEAVQQLLENGDLEMGHARALLALPFEQQTMVAREVVEKGLSVRDTERWVAEGCQPSQVVVKAAPSRDLEVERLEQKLSDHFSTRVQVLSNAKGKGKLVLSFHSLEALDGILEKFELPDR